MSKMIFPTKEMPVNHKKLNRLAKMIPLDLFYMVTVSNTEIRLQGQLKRENLIFLEKYFDFRYDKVTHFFEARRYNIYVTLTMI